MRGAASRKLLSSFKRIYTGFITGFLPREPLPGCLRVFRVITRVNRTLGYYKRRDNARTPSSSRSTPAARRCSARSCPRRPRRRRRRAWPSSSPFSASALSSAPAAGRRPRGRRPPRGACRRARGAGPGTCAGPELGETTTGFESLRGGAGMPAWTGQKSKRAVPRGSSEEGRGRGDAAAATWTFYGDDRPGVAATPRPGRGISVGTGSRRRRGRNVDIPWG